MYITFSLWGKMKLLVTSVVPSASNINGGYVYIDASMVVNRLIRRATSLSGCNSIQCSLWFNTEYKVCFMDALPLGAVCYIYTVLLRTIIIIHQGLISPAKHYSHQHA